MVNIYDVFQFEISKSSACWHRLSFLCDYFQAKVKSFSQTLTLPYQWMTLVIVDIKRMGSHHLFAIAPINHVAKIHLDKFDLKHLKCQNSMKKYLISLSLIILWPHPTVRKHVVMLVKFKPVGQLYLRSSRDNDLLFCGYILRRALWGGSLSIRSTIGDTSIELACCCCIRLHLSPTLDAWSGQI